MFQITLLGDSSLLFPLLLEMLIWIKVLDQKLASRWLCVVIAAMALLMISKLSYAATGEGVDTFYFRMISGHTMLSFTVWPVFAFLLTKDRVHWVRHASVISAFLLCVVIGATRIFNGAHSLSEVIVGGSLGFGISASFFFFWKKNPKYELVALPRFFVIASCALIVLSYGHKAPTQDWIDLMGNWIHRTI